MPYLDTRICHLKYSAKREGGECLNRLLTIMLQWPTNEQMHKLGYGPYNYESKFKPAPLQNDSIILHLKLLIRDINKADVLFANMNSRVAPTTRSPPF